MDQISLIQEALTTAQTILVTLPKELTLDKVASALALYLSFQKIPKKTTIASAKAMTVEYAGLVGVDKVTDKLAGRNLVVSFDYKEDSIEKVSYNIEGDKFNLVIQPKEGKLPLEAEKVAYRYAGEDADLTIRVGGESSLETGKAKVIDLGLGGAASYAEVVAEMLSKLRLPTDEDIARNLLAGLKEATNNFTTTDLTANTFEAAAFCLRLGARLDQDENKRTVNLAEKIEKKESPFAEALEDESAITPPPDWFEPKIYRGTQV